MHAERAGSQADIARGTAAARILVNHVLYDYARSLVSGEKFKVISVEVRISAHTINRLAEIKFDTTVLLVHQPQPRHRVHYMIAQIHRLVKSPGVKILSSSIRKIPDWEKLFSSAGYDYFLIGPGVRGEIPHEQYRNTRVVQIDPQLDRTSLESARIRAGVQSR